MPSKIPQKPKKGKVEGGVDEGLPKRKTRGRKKTAAKGVAPGIAAPAGAGKKADAPAYPASLVRAGVGLDVAKGVDDAVIGVAVGGIAVTVRQKYVLAVHPDP